jgi:hypothetical protein
MGSRFVPGFSARAVEQARRAVRQPRRGEARGAPAAQVEAPLAEVATFAPAPSRSSPENGGDGCVERPGPPQSLLPGLIVKLTDPSASGGGGHVAMSAATAVVETVRPSISSAAIVRRTPGVMMRPPLG